MLGVLLESSAKPVRRGGGVALSMMVHVAIIGAVLAAARPVKRAAPAPTPGPGIVWAKPRWPGTEIPQRPAERTGSLGRGDGRRLLPGPVYVGTSFHEFPDAGWLQPVLDGPGLPKTIEWCVNPSDCRIGGGTHAGDGGSGGERSWVGSELVARIIGDIPRPHYPDALRAAGLGGHVLVQFVVDTTGRIEPQSVRILESTHDLFARSVLAVLPRFRFQPAEVNGKRIRMAAQMPFEFTIRE